MATAIGLAMQITANTSGLASGLSDAEKMISRLSQGALQAGKAFEQFRDGSGQLPAAMKAIVEEAGFLAAAFRGGAASSDEFKAGIAEVAARATEISRLFQDGAATTAKYATEQERNAAAVAAVEKQYAAGAIGVETYQRALADLNGDNAKLAAAEREKAAALQRAAAITASVASPTEKYDKEVNELKAHLDAGRISQETYNRALERAKQDLDKATKAADGFGKEAAEAGKGLQLNEFSGILGLLPGQFGAVASRVSSFASAGSGLQKVFGAGGTGLAGAFAQLGPQIAALANPVTLAVAGIAAFGAAAAAVVSGLSNLSDRVEKLGFQAEKVGASFEFIQVLETAAQRSGSSIEAVGASFNKMLRAIDAANNGSKGAVKNFAALGVSAEDLKNKTPEEIFKQISAELIKIEDPAKRSAAAMKIFGRSGADLIPTLKAVGDAQQDMERFQAILTDLEKTRLDGVDSAFEKLSTSGQGLTQALLLPFAGLTSAVTRGSAEFTGGITAIVKPIGQVLEPALANIGAVVEVFLNGLGTIGRVVGALLAPFGEIFTAIGTFLDPIRQAWVSTNQAIGDAVVYMTEFVVSFSPIGLLAGFMTSAAEAFSSFSSQASGYIQPVMDIIERLAVIAQTAATKLYEAFQSSVGRLIEIIGSGIKAFGDFTGATAVIQAFASAVSSAFNGLWEGIKAVVSSVGGFIESVVSFAEQWLGIKRDVEEPVEAAITVDTASIDNAIEVSRKYAKEIESASEKASQYGQEGFDAAIRYQQSLQEINDLLKEGTYTQEEAKRAAENARKEFDKEIEVLDESAKAAEKAAEKKKKAADEAVKAAEKQIEADRRVADAFIESQTPQATRDRQKALETVEAITRSIAAVEADIQKARDKGDAEAVRAGNQRLAQLEQAQAAANEQVEFGFTTADADRKIEEVRKKLEDDISDADIELAPDAAKEFFDTIKELQGQLDLKLIDPQQFEQAAAAAKKVFDESKKNAEKIRDLNEKYSEEALAIELERVKALSKASQDSLKANDIRSSEGASEMLRLATGREDPAIAEYRKQTQKLDEIKKEIAKVGGTVEVV